MHQWLSKFANALPHHLFSPDHAVLLVHGIEALLQHLPLWH
jgi:hypothetical protein